MTKAARIECNKTNKQTNMFMRLEKKMCFFYFAHEIKKKMLEG